jgi:tripartite-type tricarboxylate transporter receptor subunit TctC
MFGNASSTLPFVRADQLRALAVTAATRQAYLPDLPTVAEAGLPGFEIVEWYGVIGPAGIAPGIVERLNREIMAIVGTAESRARLLDLGAEIIGGTPTQFAAYLRTELDRMTALVRTANLRME